MTKPRMTDWHPEQELAVLLDALTAELLSAFDHEICGDPGETADERQDNADAVRRLVADADPATGDPPVSYAYAPGRRSQLLRDH